MTSSSNATDPSLLVDTYGGPTASPNPLVQAACSSSDRTPAERELLASLGNELAQHERYWLDRLRDCRAVDLPVRFVAQRTTDRQRRVLRLQPEAGASNEQQKLSARDEVSCFAAWLLRLTPTDPIDCGLFVRLPPVARGLYADTVPMRIGPAALLGGEPLSAFRERMRTLLAELQARGTYARDVLARAPDLRAELEQLPRFDVSIAIEDTPEGPEWVVGEQEVRLCCYEDGSAPALVGGAGIPDHTLDGVAHQLERILRAARETGDLRLDELPIVSPAEEHTLAVDWNATTAAFPDQSTVHALVEDQVARRPEGEAVRFGSERLSYADLDARANRIAHAVCARGARPEEFVAVCLPRGADLMVALLGVLKAGCAYVPIDPEYPNRRIRQIIDDSGARLVITLRELAARFFDDRETLLADDETALAVQPMEPPRSTAGPTSPAYMIYTSGSTGKPKGVIIEHRSLVNHSWAMAQYHGLGPADRVLQSASVSFDVAAEQIFPAWLSGASVAVRPDDLLDSFARFGDFLRENEVSILILPTAFWHEWVVYLEGSGEPVPDSLRAVCVGTEKVLRHRFEAWRRLAGSGVRFMQGYGPTETTITCTTYWHDPDAPLQDGDIPIGRPLPNVTAYVVDRFDRLTPIGVEGELCIGGQGVARGYHARAQLTRERFTPDLFVTGARWYRTGDLVRFREDGNLVFVGRRDEQLKIRGHRIELGEIEAALARVVGVAAAVVQPQTLDNHGTVLVGYYVPQDGASVDAAMLRDSLLEELPRHMIPGRWVALDELPRTPNGKVDRRALPKPRTVECAFVAASNDAEARLLRLWQELFEGTRVGMNHNFEELGGTSLTAVHLVSAIEAEFGKRLPLSALIESPTPSALMGWLSGDVARGDRCLVELKKGGDTCLFMVHEVEGETSLYGNLAHRMPREIAVYGIEPRGNDRLRMIDTTIESMARRYVDKVRERQPQGPYFLGGLCAGGVIAFEMARQLEQEGQRVGLLALIDAPRPHATQRTTESRQRWERFSQLGRDLSWQRLGSVANQAIGKASRFVRYEIDENARRVSAVMKLWLLEKVFIDGRSWPARFAVPTPRELYLLAEERYRPRPIHGGRPILFRATNGDGAEKPMRDTFRDPLFEWESVIRAPIAAFDVQGGHSEILQAHRVDAIAAPLRRVIEDELRGTG